MIEYFYLNHRGDSNRFYHSRVNLGVIAVMGYSTFPKAPEQELHNQMQFIVIFRTFFVGWSLTPLQKCNQQIL